MSVYGTNRQSSAKGCEFGHCQASRDPSKLCLMKHSTMPAFAVMNESVGLQNTCSCSPFIDPRLATPNIWEMLSQELADVFARGCLHETSPPNLCLIHEQTLLISANIGSSSRLAMLRRERTQSPSSSNLDLPCLVEDIALVVKWVCAWVKQLNHCGLEDCATQEPGAPPKNKCDEANRPVNSWACVEQGPGLQMLEEPTQPSKPAVLAIFRAQLQQAWTNPKHAAMVAAPRPQGRGLLVPAQGHRQDAERDAVYEAIENQKQIKQRTARKPSVESDTQT